MKYRVKNTGGKYVECGHDSAFVSFSFGASAYIEFTRYLGLSTEECLLLRSEKINGYSLGGKVYYMKGV